jgi:hypothetical protein
LLTAGNLKNTHEKYFGAGLSIALVRFNIGSIAGKCVLSAALEVCFVQNIYKMKSKRLIKKKVI